MTGWLQTQGLDVNTHSGRALIQGLSMRLDGERVALVGRNGVGKSTLLEVLAGDRAPQGGKVQRCGSVVRVGQGLLDGPSSRGERRRALLEAALRRRPDMLLLDEPSQDLDEAGRVWLFDALRRWRGGLIVVSHDRELLGLFSHFFVLSESGCELVHGDVDRMLALLQEQATEAERVFSRRLRGLEHDERAHHRVQQRRRRKKAVGRLHELDRCQSRARLGMRKSAAQVSQAKVSGVSQARMEARRTWALASRRALESVLPLSTKVPVPSGVGGPWIQLSDVRVATQEAVTLSVASDRVAVTGPNGSGKSTLLRAMLGEERPAGGQVHCARASVGSIAQGAEDWCVEESLADVLGVGPEAVASCLVAHRFPLALAHRSMNSLSPGERTRAALVALFARPGLQVLVLDEPTYSLDLLGSSALVEALRAWRGGLVVASHDRLFLGALSWTRRLILRSSSS